MHYVKGSLGTRLEVPAKSLQVPVGGVSETCTASWVPGAPSPRATGKEALGSCGNSGLSWPDSPSGLRRACRGKRRTWSLRDAWRQPTVPSFAARSEGYPWANLWLPGLAGLPEAQGISILWDVHTLLPELDALRTISGAWWRRNPSGQTGQGPHPLGPHCQTPWAYIPQ